MVALNTTILSPDFCPWCGSYTNAASTKHADGYDTANPTHYLICIVCSGVSQKRTGALAVKTSDWQGMPDYFQDELAILRAMIAIKNYYCPLESASAPDKA